MRLPHFLRRLKVSSQDDLKQIPDPLGSLVSFPKSGRTWVRVMLDHLDLPMHYSHDGSQYSLSADYRELTPCQDNYPGQKLVFLHRDPRDTVVSGFFKKVFVSMQAMKVHFLRF